MGSNMHVLIADDDRQFIRLVTTCLTQRGYSVESADTPEEALLALRRSSPEFLILEPNQRGMSWVRFIRAARAALPSTRMGVVTSFASAAMTSESKHLGVHCFFRKPVSPALVVESLGDTWPRQPIDEQLCAEPTLEQHEWEYLNQILRKCNGNVSDTSRRLGIPRQTLYYKLRKQPRAATVEKPPALLRGHVFGPLT
jgi:two-component system, response regulator RegA